MNSLDIFMSRCTNYLSKHSATILSILACGGVAASKINVIKLNKDKEDFNLKDYIPSFVIDGATIACILGSNALNKKQQASLISAYMLLEKSYNDYKAKTKEMYGDDADANILTSISRDRDIYEKRGEGDLFWDEYYGDYFTATNEAIEVAEAKINKELVETGWVSLNRLYFYLGLKPIADGDVIGWSKYYMDRFAEQPWIDVDWEIGHMDDGPNRTMKCKILTYPCRPIPH